MQYVPIVAFNIQLLPSFAGFMIEFFWLIVPIFIISTACSCWLYHKASIIGEGTIFNALFFAWIAATTFPF